MYKPTHNWFQNLLMLTKLSYDLSLAKYKKTLKKDT